METVVVAPHSGRVTNISAVAGSDVTAGDLLFEIDASATEK